MADISTYLADIMDAVYGEDVRGSIHDAIEIINDAGEKVLSVGTAVTSSASSITGYFENSLYLNNSTWVLWKCDGTQWVSQGTIRGDDGRGITSVAKTGTSGLTDTYTITYSDNTTSTFTVSNGSGISSIVKTATAGLVDTYTVTLTDGSTSTFTVTNGAEGNGIASITLTSGSHVPGTSDTYTITFTDGTTTTFQVYNGADGAGAGDMTKAVYDSDDTVANAGGIKSFVDDNIVANTDLIKDTVGWTGKNFIPYPYTHTSQTINDVTFTIQSDGSILVNGTASANAQFLLLSSDGLAIPQGEYLLSGSGQSDCYVQIWAWRDSDHNTYIDKKSFSGDLLVSVTEDDYLVRVYGITIPSGVTVTNKMFYPMLRKADIVDDTYEPYHKTVASVINSIETLGKRVSSTVSGSTVAFTDASIADTASTVAVIDGPYIENAAANFEYVTVSGTTATFTLADDSADTETAFIWVRTVDIS